MQSVIDKYSINKARTDLPEIKPGQTIKVYQKIKEGDKERTQIFEGLVIAIHRKQGTSATVTVRKESFGIGVERIFALSAPFIEKIEVVKQAKIRRAKLFYMRGRRGKAARMKNVQITNNKKSSSASVEAMEDKQETNEEIKTVGVENLLPKIEKAEETAKAEQKPVEKEKTENIYKESNPEELKKEIEKSDKK